jgi:hypothetical protein
MASSVLSGELSVRPVSALANSHFFDCGFEEDAAGISVCSTALTIKP